MGSTDLRLRPVVVSRPPLSGQFQEKAWRRSLTACELRQQDRTPWKHGFINVSSVGLRDAVLRTAILSKGAQRSRLIYRSCGGSIEATVRAWQRGEGCTPEQWDELVRVIEHK